MRFAIIAAAFTFLIIAGSNMAVRTARTDEVFAALEQCAASAIKDEHGGPNKIAMQHCMKGKGFPLPTHSMAT